MATIQVREIPEESYEILRKRARRAGQSLQAYMRDEIVALAARPSKAEALDLIEGVLARNPALDTSVESILGDLAADRR